MLQVVMLVTGEAPVAWENLAVAVAVSGVVAYLSIEFFMRIVSNLGLLPFTLYRLLLAGLILYVLY